MKASVVCCAFLVVLGSCAKTVKNKQDEICIDKFSSRSEEINIKEIADYIDYIQLESTPESLIGRINKIQIKDHKIYVFDDMNHSLLVFDISGKFVRKMGNKGQGPGEYVEIHDFALSDSVVLVLDLMQRKMILYDTLGRFISEKYNPHNAIGRIAFCNGLPVGQCNYPDFVYNDGFRISIFDRNLDLVANVLKTEHEIDGAFAEQMNMSHALSSFANVDDTLTFWEYRDDVIYQIIDKKRVVAKTKLLYKNPVTTEDSWSERTDGRNEIEKVLETKNYIFLFGWYGGGYCRFVYLKETRTGFNMGMDGFKNNTGPNFFPINVTESGQPFQSLSVDAYKTQLEENQTSTEHLDPKLQSLLRTCDFDDNPCIMLVTLK